jgi:hypothetical protein
VLAVFVYRIFNLWLPLLPAALGLRTLKQRRPRHRGETARPIAPRDAGSARVPE